MFLYCLYYKVPGFIKINYFTKQMEPVNNGHCKNLMRELKDQLKNSLRFKEEKNDEQND